MLARRHAAAQAAGVTHRVGWTKRNGADRSRRR